MCAPQTKVLKCMNLFTSLCIWGCIRRQTGVGEWGQTGCLPEWSCPVVWMVVRAAGDAHYAQRSAVSALCVCVCVFVCVCLLCVLNISSTSHSAPDLPCSVWLNAEMWHIWVMQLRPYLTLIFIYRLMEVLTWHMLFSEKLGRNFIIWYTNLHPIGTAYWIARSSWIAFEWSEQSC